MTRQQRSAFRQQCRTPEAVLRLFARAPERLFPLIRLLGAWLVVSALVGNAGIAHAFCRSTTIENKKPNCRGPCWTQGYPVARPEPSIEYSFNERGFPGIADQQLRDVFSTAMATWTDVTCDGRPLELDISAADGTSSLLPRDEHDQYEQNVIGLLSGPEWREQGRDRFAFAVTLLRYDVNSGQLLGADMWFNGGIGTFGICPKDGCDGSDDTVDLPNVATHELGHFLGLDHSPEPGATMACEANAEDTDKRDLSPDDRAGICAIYPPGVAFRSEYKRGAWARKHSGCAVHPASSNASVGCFVLLVLGVTLRRRGRRDQPVR